MSADIAARMRKQRERWLSLDEEKTGGRALLLRRPQPLELMAYTDQGKMTADSSMRMARDAVVNWRGFTEATLLGAAIGGDTEVEFSREAFAEWLGDNPEELQRISRQVLELVNSHNEAKAETAKNSKPSSMT
jgi:hypothetical protein